MPTTASDEDARLGSDAKGLTFDLVEAEFRDSENWHAATMGRVAGHGPCGKGGERLSSCPAAPSLPARSSSRRRCGSACHGRMLASSYGPWSAFFSNQGGSTIRA